MLFYVNFPSENSTPLQQNQNTETEEFEKKIAEYKKVLNKIKELNDQITNIKKQEGKNAHMEAYYEHILKKHLEKKRLLFCTMVSDK